MDETIRLVKLLLAVLEAVGWVCPRCYRSEEEGHTPNCPHQAAIAAARSWLLRNERAEYSRPVAAELAAHGGPIYVTEIDGVPTGEY